MTDKGNKLFDMVDDPGERNDLIESTDPAIVKVKKKLEAVVRQFPSRDGVPQYDPTPPQPWDRKESTPKTKKKKRK